MLNFDVCVKNSEAAQPRVTNVKTPIRAIARILSIFTRVCVVFVRVCACVCVCRCVCVSRILPVNFSLLHFVKRLRSKRHTWKNVSSDLSRQRTLRLTEFPNSGLRSGRSDVRAWGEVQNATHQTFKRQRSLSLAYISQFHSAQQNMFPVEQFRCNSVLVSDLFLKCCLEEQNSIHQLSQPQTKSDAILLSDEACQKYTWNQQRIERKNHTHSPKDKINWILLKKRNRD